MRPINSVPYVLVKTWVALSKNSDPMLKRHGMRMLSSAFGSEDTLKEYLKLLRTVDLNAYLLFNLKSAF